MQCFAIKRSGSKIRTWLQTRLLQHIGDFEVFKSLPWATLDLTELGCESRLRLTMWYHKFSGVSQSSATFTVSVFLLKGQIFYRYIAETTGSTKDSLYSIVRELNFPIIISNSPLSLLFSKPIFSILMRYGSLSLFVAK